MKQNSKFFIIITDIQCVIIYLAIQVSPFLLIYLLNG